MCHNHKIQETAVSVKPKTGLEGNSAQLNANLAYLYQLGTLCVLTCPFEVNVNKQLPTKVSSSSDDAEAGSLASQRADQTSIPCSPVPTNNNIPSPTELQHRHHQSRQYQLRTSWMTLWR
ncbi:hypothetical protein E2C01_068724 [Portunus trituberculatus]|uniref:Uncharacterized protein n=1 Tax=Portunus trituberculatus TaxID=210409 RepID=A0A5B7HYP0_PORTR|nr:hypothetical protein [Portunus trituberculatus]